MRSMASGNEEYLKTSMSSVEEVSHSGGPLEAGATGPLLNPGPRPAAASSTGSVGPQDGQILGIKNFADHTVSAQGDNKEGQVPESTRYDSASVQLYDLYLMSPALLALTKSLGAENKPYSFQEVWQFLKAYLFKNHHLFDITNNLFNCDDLLGATFGVKQVHFHEVRYLLGKCVRKIAVPPVAGGLIKSASSNGFTHASGQSNGYNRQPFLGRSFSDQSKSYPPVHNENGKTNGESRDLSCCSTEVAGNALRNVVSCRGSSSEETASSSQSAPLDPTQSRQRMAIKDSNNSVSLCDLERRNTLNDIDTSCGVPFLSDGSVDSGRKTETELTGYDEPIRKTSNVRLVLEEEDTPVSNSDAETVYSYQGYETALCRNTEGEESEEEELGDISDDVEFEEYEIASDDDGVSEQSLSDDDVVSELEDIELAVVTLMYEDEDCWGDDDSDSESIDASEIDTDTDTDPDLAKEKWACLSCNKKNKAFMRYCEKCWQQRKNWLPDCPKRRKQRKPRPKKPKKSRIPQNGLKVPQESISTWELTDISQDCEYIGIESNTKREVTLTDLALCGKRRSRTLSDASTISIELLGMMSSEKKVSGSQRPEDGHSQDSGIGMSQELLPGSSQNLSVGSVSEKCLDSRVGSREGSESKSTKKDVISIENIVSEDSSTSVPVSVPKEESSLPSTSKVIQSSGAGILRTESESSQRTLKRKHSSEVLVATRIKKSRSDRTLPEDESLGESEEVNAKEQAKSMVRLLQSKIDFLQSAAGEEWVNTPESKRLFRVLQGEETDSLSAGITDTPAHSLCSLCFMRPKNAVVVHGRRSHQFSCYPCAKRLLNSKSRCPICRQKIHMVTQNVVV